MLGRINRIALVIFLIFLLGLSLRLVFAPRHILSSDPFLLIASAETLAETGNYLIPVVEFAAPRPYMISGWPVGFPLMLSVVFQVFGSSEVAARLFTILLGSTVIIFTGVIAHLLFRNRTVTWLSALLVALNPLLVGFDGQVFSENGSFFVLFASLTLLLLSVTEKGSSKFVGPGVILGEKKRLALLLGSMFFAGFLLTVREVEAINGLAYLFVLYKAGFSFNRTSLRLISLAAIPLVLGYSPSLYYNFINYGSPIASTGVHWFAGSELPFSIRYFFLGSKGSLHIPGGLLFLLAFLAYAFPVVSLSLVRKIDGNARFLLAFLLAVILPMLVLYGSFTMPTPIPKYVMPLIPLASILAAYAITELRQMRKSLYVLGVSLLALEQLLVFYPPPFLFSISPGLGLLTGYSPVYNIYSYKNFPDYNYTLVEWVRKNTEDNAVIITPTYVDSFYHYAKRDVVNITNVNASFVQAAGSRPVYLVEARATGMHPEELSQIEALGLSYRQVERIPLFSPYAGDTEMRIWRVENK